MKKLLLPLLALIIIPFTFSCSGVNKLTLSQADAAMAIREMLQLGARENMNGSFSQQVIMETVFPESMRKALSTLQTLGLSGEVDRFTNTLALASQRTAERSIPVFEDAINHISFTDALNIIRSGGTAATDYLKANAGADVRLSITPVMRKALDEYNLNQQWDRIIQPARSVLGNTLNLDLSSIMAGLVAEKMFDKIAEKERQVRSDALYRTTPLLQRAFSRRF
jgi:hypothetical protein